MNYWTSEYLDTMAAHHAGVSEGEKRKSKIRCQRTQAAWVARGLRGRDLSRGEALVKGAGNACGPMPFGQSSHAETESLPSATIAPVSSLRRQRQAQRAAFLRTDI